MLSDFILLSWKQPWWKYLHHSNWQSQHQGFLFLTPSPESWWLNFHQHTNEYSPPGWEEVWSQLYNRKGQAFFFFFFNECCCCCLVAHLCPILCDPVNYGRPGSSPSPFPMACSNSRPLSQWYHPSCPLSSSSLPAFNLSKHQGLF